MIAVKLASRRDTSTSFLVRILFQLGKYLTPWIRIWILGNYFNEIGRPFLRMKSAMRMPIVAALLLPRLLAMSWDWTKLFGLLDDLQTSISSSSSPFFLLVDSVTLFQDSMVDAYCSIMSLTSWLVCTFLPPLQPRSFWVSCTIQYNGLNSPPRMLSCRVFSSLQHYTQVLLSHKWLPCHNEGTLFLLC